MCGEVRARSVGGWGGPGWSGWPCVRRHTGAALCTLCSPGGVTGGPALGSGAPGSTLRLVDKGGDLLGGGEARAWRARCPGPLPAKLAMQAGRQGSWNGPRSLRAHHAQAQAVHHVAIAHGLVRDLSFAGEGPEREPGREPFEL